MIKKKNLLLSFFSLMCHTMYAQVDTASEGLNSLQNKLGINSLSRSVLIIGGAILAVGLIGLVWALATKKENAKGYVISWFVGVFFYLILLNL